jgi:glutamate 5-kinase
MQIMSVFADASHMLHSDNKGHGGIIATLGSAPIATKSYKLRLITRSSTESELVTLEEAVTLSLWISHVLAELEVGWKPPVTVLQDNDSTRIIAENGGSWQRTKHIFNRYQFVSQHVKSGEIRIERCPTLVMRADMLTKPCSPADIFRHCQALSIV